MRGNVCVPSVCVAVCCVGCPVCRVVQVAEGYKQVAQLLDHLNVDASNPLAVLTQVRQRQQGPYTLS